MKRMTAFDLSVRWWKWLPVAGADDTAIVKPALDKQENPWILRRNTMVWIVHFEVLVFLIFSWKNRQNTNNICTKSSVLHKYQHKDILQQLPPQIAPVYGMCVVQESVLNSYTAFLEKQSGGMTAFLLLFLAALFLMDGARVTFFIYLSRDLESTWLCYAVSTSSTSVEKK